MKRLLLLGLLAGCASGPSSKDSAARAPSFRLSALDGSSVRSEDLWAARPVLLVFMTSW